MVTMWCAGDVADGKTSWKAPAESFHFVCLELFLAISDTSDEQNSQSSMENSMNSSEKAEIQSSGENDLITEASKNSQVTFKCNSLIAWILEKFIFT